MQLLLSKVDLVGGFNRTVEYPKVSIYGIYVARRTSVSTQEIKCLHLKSRLEFEHAIATRSGIYHLPTALCMIFMKFAPRLNSSLPCDHSDDTVSESGQKDCCFKPSSLKASSADRDHVPVHHNLLKRSDPNWWTLSLFWDFNLNGFWWAVSWAFCRRSSCWDQD